MTGESVSSAASMMARICSRLLTLKAGYAVIVLSGVVQHLTQGNQCHVLLLVLSASIKIDLTVGGDQFPDTDDFQDVGAARDAVQVTLGDDDEIVVTDRATSL